MTPQTVDDRLADLESRLGVCETIIGEVERLVMEDVLPSMSEVGLQVMFLLRQIPVKRKRGVVISGQPDHEVLTMERAFYEQREPFIEMLAAEAAASIRKAMDEQNLSQERDGEAPADGVGDRNPPSESQSLHPASDTKH